MTLKAGTGNTNVLLPARLAICCLTNKQKYDITTNIADIVKEKANDRETNIQTFCKEIRALKDPISDTKLYC